MPLRRFDDLRPAPWRNGRGVTREVLRVPASRTGEDFAARVSIADVDADGEFSRFDGVDRIILLLRGPVMRLFVDGVRTDLTARTPFAFAGDARTRCEIDCPTRDLNVMTRRDVATAAMTVLRPGERRTVGGDGADVVIVGLGDGAEVMASPEAAAVGTASADEGADGPTHVAEMDSFVWSDAATLEVSGHAAIIVIHVAAATRHGGAVGHGTAVGTG